jgi:ferrous iron transport protein B
MIALLGIVFWITIAGANIPSSMLADGLFRLEGWLSDFILQTGAPAWVHGILITGVFRTVAWVVSVMLPPMAIFFPLFTLLEDLGYLPRVAVNLDYFLKKACAHGKQALTMCMGFAATLPESFHAGLSIRRGNASLRL